MDFFPAHRGKISLIDTKVYTAVFRKFLLFFMSQSFKVSCATGFMAKINILEQKEVVLPTGIDSQLLSSVVYFLICLPVEVTVNSSAWLSLRGMQSTTSSS